MASEIRGCAEHEKPCAEGLSKSVCVRRANPPDSAPSVSSLDPSRCAVVLGSSFLGVYAHAGFLNGLARAGFAPGRIAGASAGAIAGALYASGLRGEALRDAALDVKLRRSFVDAGWVLRLPGVLTSLWASGLFSGVAIFWPLLLPFLVLAVVLVFYRRLRRRQVVAASRVG